MPIGSDKPLKDAIVREGLWQRAIRTYGVGHTLCFVVLVVWAVACVVWMFTADSPWDAKILQRVEAGKTLKDEQFAAIALWWGAAINLAGCIWLGLSFRWWGRRNETKQDPPDASNSSVPWSFLLSLLGIVIVAWFIWQPRLAHSFTNDEEMAFRNYIWGKWKVEDGLRSFQPVTWEKTLFRSKGNNHVVQTIASRWANSVWQASGDRQAYEFSEKALRFPSVIAGLGAVLAMGALGYRIGGPRVGVCAAAFLALSPWFLRYAVEARGYAMLILGILIAIVVSIVAIERGQLRWWFLFGVAQAGFLLCFMAAVYVALAINLVLLVTIFSGTGSKNVAFSRLVGAGVIGATVYGAFQAGAAMETLGMIEERFKGPGGNIGLAWLQETLSHMVVGIPFSTATPDLHDGSSVQLGWDGLPIYRWIVMGVFPILALLGLAHMGICSWKTRVAALPTAIGVGLAVGHNAAAGNMMHLWYVVYAIIPFCLGVAWCIGRFAAIKATKQALLIVLTMGLYISVVFEPIARIRKFDRQPMREVVRSIRGTGYASESQTDGDILTATFGTSARQILSYDPWVKIPKSSGELNTLIDESSESSKALFVYFCDEQRAEREFTDLHQRVVSSSDFEKVEGFKGLEPMFLYQIYKFTGETRVPQEN